MQCLLNHFLVAYPRCRLELSQTGLLTESSRLARIVRFFYQDYFFHHCNVVLLMWLKLMVSDMPHRYRKLKAEPAFVFLHESAGYPEVGTALKIDPWL